MLFSKKIELEVSSSIRKNVCDAVNAGTCMRSRCTLHEVVVPPHDIENC